MGHIEAVEAQPLVTEIFRKLSAPVTLQWELTPDCNERCVHCYNYWLRDTAKPESVTAPFLLALYERTAPEIINNRLFHVTLTGGEPLVVLEKAYPYLEELTKAGIEMSLNSNLTILSGEKVELLKKLGIKSVLTSLISGNPELNDGLSNRPNTHRDITRGIKLALSEGFGVEVNMVVTKKNIHDLYATAEYVKDLGVRNFSATKGSTPTNSVGFEEYALSPDELKFVISELFRIRDNLGLNVDSLEYYPLCLFDTQEARDFAANRSCTAGKTNCTIGFDGMIRPCSHASQTYGSVLDVGGLKQGWENLNLWRTDAYIPAGCSDCDEKYACRGGCRSEAYVVRGDLKAPDPYCNFDHPALSRTMQVIKEYGCNAGFIFRPGIKTRVEDFGGIMFIAPARWASVTRELMVFFEKNKNDCFTMGDLASGLGFDNVVNVGQTINFLLQKSLIYKRR